MADNVISINVKNNKQPPTGGGSEPPMELDKRVERLEADTKDVRERVIRIEAKMDSFITKDELHKAVGDLKGEMHKAINDQTWKLVTFVSGFGTALAAAVYYIAKHT